MRYDFIPFMFVEVCFIGLTFAGCFMGTRENVCLAVAGWGAL